MAPDDIEKIREIINKAVADNESSQTHTFAIAFLVAVVASAFGAFIGAYMKRRGENLATKEDFDDLLTQAKHTTKATERIKSDIAAQMALKGKRHDVARKLYAEIVAVTTNVTRWKSGQKVPSLCDGEDIVPLTSAFDEMTANRALIGESVYEQLHELGTLVIEYANVDVQDQQMIDSILDRYGETQRRFNAQLVNDFYKIEDHDMAV